MFDCDSGCAWAWGCTSQQRSALESPRLQHVIGQVQLEAVLIKAQRLRFQHVRGRQIDNQTVATVGPDTLSAWDGCQAPYSEQLVLFLSPSCDFPALASFSIFLIGFIYSLFLSFPLSLLPVASPCCCCRHLLLLLLLLILLLYFPPLMCFDIVMTLRHYTNRCRVFA